MRGLSTRLTALITLTLTLTLALPAGAVGAPITANVRSTSSVRMRARTVSSPKTRSTFKRATATQLGCPVVLRTKILFPTPPYDVDAGDCALRGRTEEVEQYLQGLEGIVAACREARQAAWDRVGQQRAYIDAAIDQLPSPPPPPPPKKKKKEEDTSYPGLEPLPPLPPSPQMCASSSSSPDESVELGDDMTTPESHTYTRWLQRTAEHVQKYCTTIQELIEPIVQRCNAIVEESQCMISDPAQGGVSDGMRTAFHSGLSSAMNGAAATNESLDRFHDHTLQDIDFGNFRRLFRDENIRCEETDSVLPAGSARSRKVLPALMSSSAKPSRSSSQLRTKSKAVPSKKSSTKTPRALRKIEN